jgi:hypothetical protein
MVSVSSLRLAPSRRLVDTSRLPAWTVAGTVAALVLGPATAQAIAAGHPGTVLAAVLAIAAVLAATRGRDGWAAVLLGLAIGTEHWAMIGIVPVLVALPRRRVRALAVAAGLVAVMSVLAPLAAPAAFHSAAGAVGQTHVANAASVWWPVSSPSWPASSVLSASSSARVVRELPLGLTRSGVSLLLLGIALIGAAAVSLRPAQRRHTDALALFALLALIRASGDPLPLEYYYLPLLVALGVWEVVALGRLPIVTLMATALTAATFGVGLRLSQDALSLFSLTWALALGAYLAHRAWLRPAAKAPMVQA